MENKNHKEWILVIIGVLGTLSILFIGITYAYFTSVNNERSGSSIVAAGGKMLIAYDDGTDNIVPITNIQPSDNILVNKTFTLTGTNTTVGSGSDGLIMPYKVGFKYNSTFNMG